jgi:hypothetical protein
MSTSKNALSFLLLLCLLFNNIGEEGRTSLFGSKGGWGEGEREGKGPGEEWPNNVCTNE